MTRAVGLLLLSVKTSNPLFVHKIPWSEWIGGNKGSLAHPTRMPQAARRDRYGNRYQKKSRFGLRTDPLKAIERAHYFMNWSAPYAEPLHSNWCSYIAAGRILEPEDGTSASKAGCFRHFGPMYDQLSGEHQAATMLYYKFSAEFQELT